MLNLHRFLILLPLILMDCGNYILSQTDLKYKDIFSTLQSNKKEESYPLLRAYQAKDPYFANTYYQLGLIMEDWAREYDPLTEHDQVDYFIYYTKVYFGLAKYYLDEKQARRNGQFFDKVKPATGKSEPGFKEMQDDFDNHLKNIGIYEIHVDRSFTYFTKTVSNYNNCITLFMNICGNQNMLKEIYLTANDSLLQQTKQLQSDFDSALLFFDKFRISLDSFPLKNYKPRYFLKPIETYRLDGLTGSDFLRDTFLIWNYKDWVLNLNQLLTSEIKDIRNRVDSANHKLDNEISFFQSKPELKGSGFRIPDVDPILKNKLRKIDFGSVVLHLINYKENLLKFYALSRDSLNVPVDSFLQVPILRKSRYYQDLVSKKLLVDSLLVAFENAATKSNIKKYEKFFAQNFPGIDAIKIYSLKQQKSNSLIFDNAFDNLKNYLLYEPQNINTGNNLSWKKLTVPIKLTQPEQPDPSLIDHYLTYVSKTDKTGNLFLAGSFIPAGKKPLAFIAFAEKSKAINWLKTFDFSGNGMDFRNYALKLELTGNGCYVIIGSISPGMDSVAINNTLIRLDMKGNELLRQKCCPGSLIRWLLFDDINNKLFAAFQGKKFGLTETLPAPLIFTSMDSIGYTLWNYSANMEGHLAEIVRMDENWLIFSNVSAYLSENKWIRLNDEMGRPVNGILSILINGSGGLIQTIQFKKSNPAELFKLVKLDSETLNIFAFRNNEKTNPGSFAIDPGKFVYILVDKKGVPFYLYH